MGLGREEEIEVYSQPRFRPGAKVRATLQIRNDGTVAGREIGEILVRKGDVGYVRDVGMYLQRFYVYAVEFVDRQAVIGMRGRELAEAGPRAAEKAS
jgi:nitrogen fixation protein NifZ